MGSLDYVGFIKIKVFERGTKGRNNVRKKDFKTTG